MMTIRFDNQDLHRRAAKMADEPDPGRPSAVRGRHSVNPPVMPGTSQPSTNESLRDAVRPSGKADSGLSSGPSPRGDGETRSLMAEAISPSRSQATPPPDPPSILVVDDEPLIL